MINRRPRHLNPLAILLLSIALAAPVTAQADPLGQLVNMIMNKILNDRANEEEQQRNERLGTPNRTISTESKIGTMSPPVGNTVKIDGDDYQLAFNSRIRDEGNRIVHTTMIQNKKRVRYTLNAQNQIDQVWLLTQGEQ